MVREHLDAAAAASAPDTGATAAELRNERAIELLSAAQRVPDPERQKLRQRVVLDHLDVAEAVAHRYRSGNRDWDDVRQVAYIGLTKAAQRFDPERGVDFVSFAVPTIAGEIKRYIRDTSWVVRPPRRLQELYVRVAAESPRLSQQLGHSPTVAELAEHLGEPPVLVAEAIDCVLGMRPSSLDAPAGDFDSGSDLTTLADCIGGDDEHLAQTELVATLQWACRSLTPRECRIVYLRFWQELTQSEIAAEIGVTQMQVSRLLAKILATLRDRLDVGSLAA